MDESDEDPRLPHHRNPQEFVSLDRLAGHNLQNTLSLIFFFFLLFFFFFFKNEEELRPRRKYVSGL